MNCFISEQLSVSTAEEENNYFTGQPPAIIQLNLNAILPPGMYRVIDGRLYRVVDGVSAVMRSPSDERQR